MFKVEIRHVNDPEGTPLEVKEFGVGTVAIGRVRANDIVLNAPNISKFHSRIIVREDTAVVVDNQSTNGTIVNGDAIGAPRLLQTGDVLQVGDFLLRVEYTPGDATSVDDKAPAQSHSSGIFSLEKMDEMLADAPASPDINFEEAARLFDLEDIDAVAPMETPEAALEKTDIPLDAGTVSPFSKFIAEVGGPAQSQPPKTGKSKMLPVAKPKPQAPPAGDLSEPLDIEPITDIDALTAGFQEGDAGVKEVEKPKPPIGTKGQAKQVIPQAAKPQPVSPAPVEKPREPVTTQRKSDPLKKPVENFTKQEVPFDGLASDFDWEKLEEEALPKQAKAESKPQAAGAKVAEVKPVQPQQIKQAKPSKPPRPMSDTDVELDATFNAIEGGATPPQSTTVMNPFIAAFNNWLTNETIEEIWILPSQEVRLLSSNPPALIKYEKFEEVLETVEGLCEMAGTKLAVDGRWTDLANGWEAAFYENAFENGHSIHLRRSYSSIVEKFSEEVLSQISDHLSKRGSGLIIASERENEGTIWQAVLPLLPKQKWGVFIADKPLKRLPKGWYYISDKDPRLLSLLTVLSPNIVAVGEGMNSILKSIYSLLHGYEIGLIYIVRAQKSSRAVKKLSSEIGQGDIGFSEVLNDLTGAALVELRGKWNFEKLHGDTK